MSQDQPPNVSSLAAFRARQQATYDSTPDPEHVSSDHAGQPVYRYSCGYTYAGRLYSVDIWARDWEDAERTVAAMRLTLLVDGQVHAEYPA